VVKKVNRMNTALRAGMVIAVPNNIDSVGLMELAPFSSKIDAPQTNLVQISLSKLAWGAYDANGNLVNWGPVSGGKNYCADVRRGCKTPTGSYVVYSEKGANCKSSRFPLETHGGAPMPYCMHFKGGYAMHGSPTVPGFHASHGCVRMFTEDAKWLNINFVESGSTRVRIIP
jgi:lipoprotein-anchoring transpeptidase ErfK/SrfK